MMQHSYRSRGDGRFVPVDDISKYGLRVQQRLSKNGNTKHALDPISVHDNGVWLRNLAIDGGHAGLKRVSLIFV